MKIEITSEGNRTTFIAGEVFEAILIQYNV